MKIRTKPSVETETAMGPDSESCPAFFISGSEEAGKLLCTFDKNRKLDLCDVQELSKWHKKSLDAGV